MSANRATNRLLPATREVDGRNASANSLSFRQLLLILLALAACLAATSAQATNPPAVMKVEEDWVVEIGVPDPAGTAPQITVTMAPWGHLEHLHAVFELNHQNLPAYADGGMQLQTWYGDYAASYFNYPNGNVLSTNNETVKFTTSMNLTSGKLWFEIKNGQSQTWSSFGGQGYLKGWNYTVLNNLNLYSPEKSVEFSKVGFAAHRVKKLVLKEVRYYSSSGLISTDTAERVVHQHLGES